MCFLGLQFPTRKIITYTSWVSWVGKCVNTAGGMSHGVSDTVHYGSSSQGGASFVGESLAAPPAYDSTNKYMNGQPEKNISMVFLKMSSNFEG